MIETIVPILLATSAIITYVLQLWTGFAVAGWQGENALIDRRTRPGPYWIIMAFQTVVLILVPVLMAVTN